ncbi:MAG: hypothetical protein CMF96_04180 [Candidatus Marinimicrobia bacterium]|nr:hypothetical protein [Candidatus Neomarinimicrobiota bacterium]|tara:strand:- start:657 stop:1472 length:816 start_codon:yes stop_codon:yes gene_type:complete
MINNIIYFFLISNILSGQCSGCNENFQNINIWNIKNNCSQIVKHYNDCSLLDFFNLIDKDKLSNYLDLGSQRWEDGILKYFYFFDNSYTIDEASLSSLNNVKYLFIDGTPIQINSQIHKISFKSEYLLLRQNNMKIPLKNITFTDSLKYISLDENEFFGEFPEALLAIPNLYNLSVEFNNLTGKFPKYIPNETSLNILTINNNQLEGLLPESICELTELKILHLQYNNFTNIPECICDMNKKGVEIELYGNNICSNIPDCAESFIGFQNCY